MMCLYTLHVQDEVSISSEPPAKRLKTKIRKVEPPLEMPFKLPVNYPKAVEEGIAAGNLIGITRTRFISSVAAAVYHKKTYPSKFEYEHVASQIISTYPFMADEKGSHVRMLQIMHALRCDMWNYVAVPQM